MLDDAAFERVRPGVLIINAARGGIVDEGALLRALDTGRVGGAALDVFEQEPPSADHPLVGHDKVICTPHLGASTEQAQVNVAIAVSEQVRDYLIDGVVGAALNMPSVSKEVYQQIRPYLELGEKLGRFQGQLSSGSIEQIEIEFSGDAASLELAMKDVMRDPKEAFHRGKAARTWIAEHGNWDSIVDSQIIQIRNCCR